MEGYLYCFSNEAMPGLLKIGMTTRSPLKRLDEANSQDTFKPPHPYVIELAKKVKNPKEKEKTLHSILEKNKKREHPEREFFRITVDEIESYFNLMEGEKWVNTIVEENTNLDNDCDDSEIDDCDVSYMNDKNEYEVEAVRSKKKIRGKIYYEIKWAKYPESDNLFILYANCNEYLKKYIMKNRHKIPNCRKSVRQISIAK